MTEWPELEMKSPEIPKNIVRIPRPSVLYTSAEDDLKFGVPGFKNNNMSSANGDVGKQMDEKIDPGPATEGTEKKSFNGCWEHFCDNTSFLGFRFLTHGYRTWFRIFWTCCMICFAGLTVYQLVNRVIWYIENPTAIQINYPQPTSMDYPEITICPKTQYRVSTLGGKIEENLEVILNDLPQKKHTEAYRKMAVDLIVKLILRLHGPGNEQHKLNLDQQIRKLPEFFDELYHQRLINFEKVLSKNDGNSNQNNLKKALSKWIPVARVLGMRSLAEVLEEISSDPRVFEDYDKYYNDRCVISKGGDGDYAGDIFLDCPYSYASSLLLTVLEGLRVADTNVLKSGPTVEDNILRCEWGPTGRCKVSQVPSPTGMCFLIEPAQDQRRLANETGSQGSISLVLEMERHESFLQGAGSFATLHLRQPGTYTRGTTTEIRPGQVTELGINAVNTIKVHEDFCGTKDLEHSDSYTKDACLWEEAYAGVRESCHCRPSTAPTSNIHQSGESLEAKCKGISLDRTYFTGDSCVYMGKADESIRNWEMAWERCETIGKANSLHGRLLHFHEDIDFETLVDFVSSFSSTVWTSLPIGAKKTKFTRGHANNIEVTTTDWCVTQDCKIKNGAVLDGIFVRHFEGPNEEPRYVANFASSTVELVYKLDKEGDCLEWLPELGVVQSAPCDQLSTETSFFCEFTNPPPDDIVSMCNVRVGDKNCQGFVATSIIYDFKGDCCDECRSRSWCTFYKFHENICFLGEDGSGQVSSYKEGCVSGRVTRLQLGETEFTKTRDSDYSVCKAIQSGFIPSLWLPAQKWCLVNGGNNCEAIVGKFGGTQAQAIAMVDQDESARKYLAALMSDHGSSYLLERTSEGGSKYTQYTGDEAIQTDACDDNVIKRLSVTGSFTTDEFCRPMSDFLKPIVLGDAECFTVSQVTVTWDESWQRCKSLENSLHTKTLLRLDQMPLQQIEKIIAYQFDFELEVKLKISSGTPPKVWLPMKSSVKYSNGSIYSWKICLDRDCTENSSFPMQKGQGLNFLSIPNANESTLGLCLAWDLLSFQLEAVACDDNSVAAAPCLLEAKRDRCTALSGMLNCIEMDPVLTLTDFDGDCCKECRDRPWCNIYSLKNGNCFLGYDSKGYTVKILSNCTSGKILRAKQAETAKGGSDPSISSSTLPQCTSTAELLCVKPMLEKNMIRLSWKPETCPEDCGMKTFETDRSSYPIAYIDITAKLGSRRKSWNREVLRKLRNFNTYFRSLPTTTSPERRELRRLQAEALLYLDLLESEGSQQGTLRSALAVECKKAKEFHLFSFLSPSGEKFLNGRLMGKIFNTLTEVLTPPDGQTGAEDLVDAVKLFTSQDASDEVCITLKDTARNIKNQIFLLIQGASQNSFKLGLLEYIKGQLFNEDACDVDFCPDGLGKKKRKKAANQCKDAVKKVMDDFGTDYEDLPKALEKLRSDYDKVSDKLLEADQLIKALIGTEFVENMDDYTEIDLALEFGDKSRAFTEFETNWISLQGLAQKEIPNLVKRISENRDFGGELKSARKAMLLFAKKFTKEEPWASIINSDQTEITPQNAYCQISELENDCKEGFEKLLKEDEEKLNQCIDERHFLYHTENMQNSDDKDDMNEFGFLRMEWFQSFSRLIDNTKKYSPGTEYNNQNLAYVRIFFNQFRSEDIVQQEAFGIFDLLSDLGGTFGLYLGATLITFIETVFILCEYSTNIIDKA